MWLSNGYRENNSSGNKKTSTDTTKVDTYPPQEILEFRCSEQFDNELVSNCWSALQCGTRLFTGNMGLEHGTGILEPVLANKSSTQFISLNPSSLLAAPSPGQVLLEFSLTSHNNCTCRCQQPINQVEMHEVIVHVL